MPTTITVSYNELLLLQRWSRSIVPSHLMVHILPIQHWTGHGMNDCATVAGVVEAYIVAKGSNAHRIKVLLT